MGINITFYFPFCHDTFFMSKTLALESTFNICIHHFEFHTHGENHICSYVEHVYIDTITLKSVLINFSLVATIFVSVLKISDNAGQNVYSPDMPSLQLLEGKLKCPLVRIQGGLYLLRDTKSANCSLFSITSGL